MKVKRGEAAKKKKKKWKKRKQKNCKNCYLFVKEGEEDGGRIVQRQQRFVKKMQNETNKKK